MTRWPVSGQHSRTPCTLPRCSVVSQVGSTWNSYEHILPSHSCEKVAARDMLVTVPRAPNLRYHRTPGQGAWRPAVLTTHRPPSHNRGTSRHATSAVSSRYTH